MSDKPEEPNQEPKGQTPLDEAYRGPEAQPEPLPARTGPSRAQQVLAAVLAGLLYPTLMFGLALIAIQSAVAAVFWFIIVIACLVIAIRRVTGPYIVACIILISWSALGLLVGGFVFMLILSCSGGLFH